jgi:hypothetical protein
VLCWQHTVVVLRSDGCYVHHLAHHETVMAQQDSDRVILEVRYVHHDSTRVPVEVRYVHHDSTRVQDSTRVILEVRYAHQDSTWVQRKV